VRARRDTGNFTELSTPNARFFGAGSVPFLKKSSPFFCLQLKLQNPKKNEKRKKKKEKRKPKTKNEKKK
jgi:hypothetical protein